MLLRCPFTQTKRFARSYQTNAPPVLHVYRQILRLAKNYPSIKRDGVIEEIRLEFRENKIETDEKKVKLAMDKALFGISHLQKYVFNTADAEWVVDLEKEPMPPQAKS